MVNHLCGHLQESEYPSLHWPKSTVKLLRTLLKSSGLLNASTALPDPIHDRVAQRLFIITEKGITVAKKGNHLRSGNASRQLSEIRQIPIYMLVRIKVERVKYREITTSTDEADFFQVSNPDHERSQYSNLVRMFKSASATNKALALMIEPGILNTFNLATRHHPSARTTTLTRW